jgi:hypothetical protein
MGTNVSPCWAALSLLSGWLMLAGHTGKNRAALDASAAASAAAMVCAALAPFTLFSVELTADSR